LFSSFMLCTPFLLLMILLRLYLKTCAVEKYSRNCDNLFLVDTVACSKDYERSERRCASIDRLANC
jgi:hypothetical protein